MVVSPRGGSLPTTLAPPGGRERICSKRPLLFLRAARARTGYGVSEPWWRRKVGGRGCCLAPADRATDHTPVSPTMMSWPPAAKKNIYGDVIICASVHVYTTHASKIDGSYVGRCHSSRVAPFIGTSSPAVDTLLRCHVQPFCEPVALHNSSAAWHICPHKGIIIVHRREVALSERCPVLGSKPMVSNQWRNSRFQ